MLRFGWSRLWTALVVSVAIIGTTALSWAGPLLPSFPAVWAVGQAVAGQSTLGPAPGSPLERGLEVDWIVVFLGPVGPHAADVWGYYYQIENDTGTTVSSFTVTTPGPPFFAAGFIAGADLDAGFFDPLTGLPIAGHTAATYPNLGPPGAETENAGAGIGVNPTGFTLALTDVTWVWLDPLFGGLGELPNLFESPILYAYATVPPTYGNAGALNTIPPSPWGSTQPGGQPVPVPSPEPGTVVLLMMGLGFGVLYWRRSLTK